MKTKALLAGLVSLASLWHGCGGRPEDSTRAETGPAAVDEDHRHHDDYDHAHADQGTPTDEHVPHGVEFREGRGLTVPELTRGMLGLKIVDVEEGKATRRIELPLRVFKREPSNGESFVLASGAVETNLLPYLEPGTEVTAKTANTGAVLGKVARIETGSVQLTGLAEVIVKLPRKDDVAIGTFVDGTVTATTPEDVAVIPKEALLKTAEGYFAYVVNGDSLFRTKIGVGGQAGDVVEVTDGLYTGDRVVLQPIMPLWLAELQAIRGGKACIDGH